MRYNKIENLQGIEGNFYMDKKRGFIIPESQKKNNHIFSKIAMPLLALSLTGCPGPSTTTPYSVSLDNFEQNGRYAMLDIGFNDNITGNDATIDSKIQFENAEIPTQEAFDLFEGEDNNSNGDLKLYENKNSKVLVYLKNPGEKITATIQAGGNIYSLEQMTEDSIEYIKVPDTFEENTRRKLIEPDSFNTSTRISVPSEGIRIRNAVFTEGTLRSIHTTPDIGSATCLDSSKPNEYTVYNLSSANLPEFKRKIETLISQYWWIGDEPLTVNNLNANIRMGVFTSLEEYLNGTYTRSPFNYSNTYTKDYANLEYKINTDDSQDFNLSVKDGNDFFIYYNKNESIYTATMIGFLSENNIFNRYELNSQNIWIKKVGENSPEYITIEELIPEKYNGILNSINNAINYLND